MNSQEKNLQIGQIIYILSNVKQKIVPAIVVEEIIVKKIDGNQISWKIGVGPPGKEKIIDSNRIDGNIYASLEEIRDVLTKRLTSFLDDLINEAERRAESWYHHHISKIAEHNIEKNMEKIAPEKLLSEFDNQLENTSFDNSRTNNLNPEITAATERIKLREELRKRLVDEMTDASHTLQSKID